MKSGVKENNLIEKIKNDAYFEKILPELPNILDAKTFIGCAPEQVSIFYATTHMGHELGGELRKRELK